MADLPSGTVTFLFTDIEGSMGLWEREAVARARSRTREQYFCDRLAHYRPQHLSKQIVPEESGTIRAAAVT